ncbi:MAG: hypothetical protein Q6351_004790 [Candidatus Njordarchaeum guaymaensis]
MKLLKWFAAFILISLSLATLLYLEPSAFYVFLGAFSLYLGIVLFNKGRREVTNLKTDITPIAFAFVVFLLALIYAAFGYLQAIAIAIVMAVLIVLLYKVI